MLHVAMAKSDARTVRFIWGSKKQCIVPKVDFTDAELTPSDAPYRIDYDMAQLLDLEMRPLKTCLITMKKDDSSMLKKVWQRYSSAWESCHFYKLIETLL